MCGDTTASVPIARCGRNMAGERKVNITPSPVTRTPTKLISTLGN